jgi:hypothetical protein
VVLDASSGEDVVLVSDADAAAVARARSALGSLAAVELGGDHVHTIRAMHRDERGRRGPLSESELRAALAAAGPGALRVVPGESQTDLVPAEVNKARGLERLTARLGEAAAIAAGSPSRAASITTASDPSGAATLIELAVGDAVEDLPMLRAARLGIAPANADALVRRSGERIAKRPYQRGLAEAVGQLVGHEPGACPTCAAHPTGRRADLLLSVLAARESGPVGLAARALNTTRLVRRRHA